MTLHTKKVMRRIRKRIEEHGNMANRHCGFDSEVQKFLDYEEKLIKEIQSEIEALATKAGVA